LTLTEKLPPILSLIDDHEADNVDKGLEELLACFHHYKRRDFLDRNWAMVIYDALIKVVGEKDPRIVEKLPSALLKSLELVAEDPNAAPDKLSKYDDVMQKMLFTMELLTDVEHKKAWLPQLNRFIERMGHASLHWVERINDILLEYSNITTDPELVVCILQTIQVLVKNTWAKPSSREWIEIILRILFNRGITVSMENESLDLTKGLGGDICTNVRECFDLISHCEDFPECRVDLNNTIQGIRENVSKTEYRGNFLNELEKCNILQLL